MPEIIPDDWADDRMQLFEVVSYMCDGEPWSFFVTTAVPAFVGYSAIELMALSAFLHRRWLDEAADFTADYAREVWSEEVHSTPRPEPQRFLQDWLTRRAANPETEPRPTSAEIAQGVARLLRESNWPDAPPKEPPEQLH
jgi:hypothetical protein